MSSVPAHWLVPDWPAPPTVRAACSVRDGGVSADPYASLNLGSHVGDDAVAVAENRRRFSTALGVRPVFLNQVHGTTVAALTSGSRDGIEADACWTSERGVACTIMVADCLPVLFADEQGAVVGAAHCGWRGLAGAGGEGILERLWAELRPRIAGAEGAAARRTHVWLGPCIGPGAFEVGEDVRQAFVQRDADADRLFKRSSPGKFLADLPGLARRRLHALGLDQIRGNDGSAAWCTVSQPSRFFSHRRDRVSGRFAASIWLR